MGNEGADADDRVVDVLRKAVAQLGTNFVIALADVAVRGGEAPQVGDRLNIPYDDVSHATYSAYYAFQVQPFEVGVAYDMETS